MHECNPKSWHWLLTVKVQYFPIHKNLVRSKMLCGWSQQPTRSREEPKKT